MKRGLDAAGIEIPFPYLTLTKNDPDIINAIPGRSGASNDPAEGHDEQPGRPATDNASRALLAKTKRSTAPKGYRDGRILLRMKAHFSVSLDKDDNISDRLLSILSVLPLAIRLNWLRY